MKELRDTYDKQLAENRVPLTRIQEINEGNQKRKLPFTPKTSDPQQLRVLEETVAFMWRPQSGDRASTSSQSMATPTSAPTSKYTPPHLRQWTQPLLVKPAMEKQGSVRLPEVPEATVRDDEPVEEEEEVEEDLAEMQSRLQALRS